MLRQCISLKQKDWIYKLLMIEYAINTAQLETTGYTLFFLNYEWTPWNLLQNDSRKDEYSRVRTFTQKVKDVILQVHDAILQARVKQTRHTNRHRRVSPFKLNNLVYVSTKNMNLPRQQARKLVLKYIGPYRIIRNAENEAFELELLLEMKNHNIHPVFHTLLLRIHVLNNDRLFPRREVGQVTRLSNENQEWTVDSIETHVGKGRTTLFKVL